MIPTILAVSFIVFALLDLAPGSIIDAMITDEMTMEDIEALRIAHNFHRPMVYRFGLYMLNLVRGDLGYSDLSGLSVWNLYMTRLPNTLILALATLVVGSAVGIPLGIHAAKRSGSITDNALTVVSLLGMSMPNFWMGLLLLFAFALHLGWLPASGNRDGILSLILPAVTAGSNLMASSMRQTRSSMLEVFKSDYLRTARAKGVPEEKVIRKHALGNAWIPILTTMGSSLSIAIAGSAVVEIVFAWPGVGRMLVEAALSRDVTLTMGTVIMTTFLFVLVQLLVDLVYAFVDPRIKAQFSNFGRKKKTQKTTKAALVAETQEQDSSGTDFDNNENIDAPVSAVISNNIPAQQDEPEIILSSENATEPIPDSAVAPTLNAGAKDRPARNQSNANSTYELVSKKYKKHSLTANILYQLKSNKGALAGMIILGIILLAFIASLFISFDAVTTTNVRGRFAPPSWQYPFGTDNFGRNLLLRVIYGSRYSIAIGLGVSAIAVSFGVFFGAIAGYYSGHVENVIMRIFDVIASIPGTLLGIVIVTMMGQSLQNLIIAVGVTLIPSFVRITRATVLTVRDNEFVEASKAIGLSNARVIFTQVLPNAMSPIIVTLTTGLGMAILLAASLSFIGFGVAVPHPEWGAMISTGRDYIRIAPWITTFPGIAIMLIVLAFNLLGDGLRDALDPKLKK